MESMSRTCLDTAKIIWKIPDVQNKDGIECIIRMIFVMCMIKSFIFDIMGAKGLFCKGVHLTLV